MAQEMYKHDALLHILWSLAQVNIKVGEVSKYGNATPEENSYINLVRKNEKINIDWEEFGAKRKSLGHDSERIIDEACKALNGCGKDWKIKALGYMQRMAWVSNEGGYKDDLEQNISEKEWALILRAQEALGLTNEERKNSYQNLPSK
jgi:hypothetical protein